MCNIVNVGVRDDQKAQDSKFPDRKIWANSADPYQTATSGLIRVCTVCYSICIFLMKYPNV